MLEFFHGWRRKLGSIAVLVACVVTMAWCRSLIVEDKLILVSGSTSAMSGLTLRQITSESAILRWETISHIENFMDSAVPESRWTTGPLTEFGNIGHPGLCQPRFQWGGFELAAGDFVSTRVSALAVPYWSLALPLTLASAYLILWKPRLKR